MARGGTARLRPRRASLTLHLQLTHAGGRVSVGRNGGAMMHGIVGHKEVRVLAETPHKGARLEELDRVDGAGAVPGLDFGFGLRQQAGCIVTIGRACGRRTCSGCGRESFGGGETCVPGRKTTA